jgi:transcriptional regulator
MYAHPKHVLSEDEALAIARTYGRAAIIVTGGAAGLAATHAPILWQDMKILTHVARANAHWREAPCHALVILGGAETYVSPSWYGTKHRTGRAVPTWNYEAVHIFGRLVAFEDRARLRALVAALSDRHEAGRAAPWRLEDAPGDYIEGLLGAIVGLELTVERIEGKRKLSQEKPDEDFDGVLAALSASDDARDRAVAEAMASTRRPA